MDVSHRISNIQEIDFEDNIQDFIDTIHSHDKQYFELLIQNIDFHKMKESINKIGNYYQDEYRVKYKDKGLRLLNSLKDISNKEVLKHLNSFISFFYTRT
ncbi:hypothetical protein F6Y05_02145 [Bacillus megaterium]|nr:hypothetical protein [Priestia megaterium]